MDSTDSRQIIVNTSSLIMPIDVDDEDTTIGLPTAPGEVDGLIIGTNDNFITPPTRTK